MPVAWQSQFHGIFGWGHFAPEELLTLVGLSGFPRSGLAEPVPRHLWMGALRFGRAADSRGLSGFLRSEVLHFQQHPGSGFAGP